MTKKIKKNWKSILSVVVVIALLMGTLGLVIGLGNRNTRTTINSSAFSRGSLNSSGKYVESNQSIYTKEAFGCIGLRVAPDFEFNGTYDVFYYDYNDKLVDSKIGLDSIYEEDYPLSMMARIVIHPNIPEGENASEYKIKWYEVSSIANMFDITVNENQEWSYSSNNLYDDTKAIYDKSFDIQSNTKVEIKDNNHMKVSDKIIVEDGVVAYDVYVKKTVQLENQWTLAVVSEEDDTIVDFVSFDLTSPAIGEWCSFRIEIPEELDSGYLLVRMPKTVECYIFACN